MITGRILTEQGLTNASFEECLAAAEDAVVWVDVVGRYPDELKRLGDRFGFHSLAIEDCLHTHQRAKLEDYGEHLFLVFYGLGRTASEDDDEEFDVFMTSSVLVTVREGTTTDLAPILRRLHGAPPPGARAGWLAWALLDEVVDNMFPLIDDIEESIEHLEDQIFEVPRLGDLQQRIFVARKELQRFRRRVTPLREIMNALISRPEVSRAVFPYLQDVYDHVLRMIDSVDTLRERAISSHDAYQSEVANDMNRVMKRFTSIGAILVSGALITGIYGMNFSNMPELDWRFGYPIAITGMIAIMVGLYVYFKRRDWL